MRREGFTDSIEHMRDFNAALPPGLKRTTYRVQR